MSYHWVYRLLIATVVLPSGVLPSGAHAADEIPVSELLARMNARCTAIQTATIEYQYGTCRADPSQPKPWAWDPEQWSAVRKPVALTLSGDEWVLRHVGGNTVMHRGVLDARYLHTDQPDGSALRECRLTPPLADMDTELERDFKFRVIRAGTVPTGHIYEYLKRRQSDAHDGGVVMVEGDAARLLEWEVPAADFPGLDLWFDWKAVKLRLYLLPEMGGAVRRLDYATLDGKLGARYESNNFRKVADGIWFPWNYYFIVDQTELGRGYAVDQYIVEKVTGVNQDVPESVFDLEIPEGTHILDARDPKKVMRFTAGAVTRLSKVDSSLQRKEAQPAPGRFSRLLLIGMNVAVVALLCGLTLFRRAKLSKDVER